MFKCKYCGTEMKKIYSFNSKSYQQMMCPNCGSATTKRPIVFDSDGNLITHIKKKKNNKTKPNMRSLHR